MAAPPANWQANFQQTLRSASQRFEDGMSKFGTLVQQGYSEAQVGFNNVANRTSVAVKGYSQKFANNGNVAQGSLGKSAGRPGAVGGFSQMASFNPQFPTLSPQSGIAYQQKQPLISQDNGRDDGNSSRCSRRTLIGIIAIIVILAGGGAGVGILLNQNNIKRNAALNGIAATSNLTINSTGPFNIQVNFISAVSTSQQEAFIAAAARWGQIMTAGLPSQAQVNAGDQFCGITISQSQSIQDLLIFAEIVPIDGVGKILGSSAPCGFDENNIPRLGLMKFDSADVANLESNGQFTTVVLHEMGHVLGLGTLWDNPLNLLTPAFDSKNPQAPVTYTGKAGNAANVAVGANGAAVVENLGGAGTARGHWKDSVYQTELMTGFLSSGQNPLSKLTIGALQDIGYSVDATKADNYQFPSGRRLRSTQSVAKIPFGADILDHPRVQMKTKTKGSVEEYSLKPRNHVHRP